MFGTWVNPNAPDVILEVGPHPCSTRFAAHSTLLATHSGYLRAALRTLEQQHASTFSPLRRVLQNHSNGSAINVPSEICALSTATSNSSLLYLPNISPEQFTPLLSYMYTGYLDLTMDNIFGVLLATHLLHMPRALELCRAYLSSSAASATNASTCTSLSEPLHHSLYTSKPDTSTTSTFSASCGTSRLVRPIASKAMATVGLSFIAPPTASQINLLPSAPFRSLGSNVVDIPAEFPEQNKLEHDANSPSQSPISVTHFEEERITPLTPQNSSVLEDDVNTMNIDIKCDENISKPDDQKQTGHNNTELSASLNNENRASKCSAQTGFAKRQKNQQDAINDSTNGVIIDIASCDGPVRFRRVLNVMYGCNTNNRGTDCADATVEDSSCFTDAESSVKKRNTRSLRYASMFHQQMARNISSTGKLTYESSSSSSNSSCHKFHNQQTVVSATPLAVQQDQNSKDENSQGDVTPFTADTEGNSNYTCVYCKHTFKSHYCYQKHAKRHLIPLCLDSRSTASCAVSTVKTMTTPQPKPYDARRRLHQNSTSSSNTIRREVKPLDMNVQYYPCKTCGSKFPSYYFVHKHRKLCHTEEEDDVANLSASTTSSSHNISAHIPTKGSNEASQPEHADGDGIEKRPSDLMATVDHTPQQIEQH